jgi:hypothetical protein
MNLRLATLKAVSFCLLHNVSTLINAESFPVAQLCVNTLLATKVTLITDGIYFGSLRVKTIVTLCILDNRNHSTLNQTQLHGRTLIPHREVGLISPEERLVDGGPQEPVWKF